MRLISWLLVVVSQFCLATRYYFSLRYSWHLAWIKAER